MADIFSVQPPQWLQNIAKPIEGEKLGQTLGLLAASLQKTLVNSNKDESDPTRENKGFSDYWMESRLNLTDPLWREKQQALQNQNALRKQVLTDRLGAQSEVASWLKNSQGNPTWMTDHPYTGSNPVAAKQISTIQDQAKTSLAYQNAKQAAVLKIKAAGDRSLKFQQGLTALEDPAAQARIEAMVAPNSPVPDTAFTELAAALKKEGKQPPWIKPVLPLSPVGKLESDRAKAIAEGNQQAADELTAAIKKQTTTEETVPKTMTLGGETLIYNPKSGHFVLKKGTTEKQLTPAQMVSIVNALPVKDPNRKKIMDFLSSSATNQIATPKPAAAPQGSTSQTDPLGLFK